MGKSDRYNLLVQIYERSERSESDNPDNPSADGGNGNGNGNGFKQYYKHSHSIPCAGKNTIAELGNEISKRYLKFTGFNLEIDELLDSDWSCLDPDERVYENFSTKKEAEGKPNLYTVKVIRKAPSDGEVLRRQREGTVTREDLFVGRKITTSRERESSTASTGSGSLDEQQQKKRKRDSTRSQDAATVRSIEVGREDSALVTHNTTTKKRRVRDSSSSSQAPLRRRDASIQLTHSQQYQDKQPFVEPKSESPSSEEVNLPTMALDAMAQSTTDPLANGFLSHEQETPPPLATELLDQLQELNEGQQLEDSESGDGNSDVSMAVESVESHPEAPLQGLHLKSFHPEQSHIPDSFPPNTTSALPQYLRPQYGNLQDQNPTESTPSTDAGSASLLPPILDNYPRVKAPQADVFEPNSPEPKRKPIRGVTSLRKSGSKSASGSDVSGPQQNATNVTTVRLKKTPPPTAAVSPQDVASNANAEDPKRTAEPPPQQNKTNSNSKEPKVEERPAAQTPKTSKRAPQKKKDKPEGPTSASMRVTSLMELARRKFPGNAESSSTLSPEEQNQTAAAKPQAQNKTPSSGQKSVQKSVQKSAQKSAQKPASKPTPKAAQKQTVVPQPQVQPKQPARAVSDSSDSGSDSDSDSDSSSSAPDGDEIPPPKRTVQPAQKGQEVVVAVPNAASKVKPESTPKPAPSRTKTATKPSNVANKGASNAKLPVSSEKSKKPPASKAQRPTLSTGQEKSPPAVVFTMSKKSGVAKTASKGARPQIRERNSNVSDSESDVSKAPVHVLVQASPTSAQPSVTGPFMQSIVSPSKQAPKEPFPVLVEDNSSSSDDDSEDSRFTDRSLPRLPAVQPPQTASRQVPQRNASFSQDRVTNQLQEESTQYALESSQTSPKRNPQSKTIQVPQSSQFSNLATPTPVGTGGVTSSGRKRNLFSAMFQDQQEIKRQEQLAKQQSQQSRGLQYLRNPGLINRTPNSVLAAAGPAKPNAFASPVQIQNLDGDDDEEEEEEESDEESDESDEESDNDDDKDDGKGKGKGKGIGKGKGSDMGNKSAIQSKEKKNKPNSWGPLFSLRMSGR